MISQKNKVTAESRHIARGSKPSHREQNVSFPIGPYIPAHAHDYKASPEGIKATGRQRPSDIPRQRDLALAGTVGPRPFSLCDMRAVSRTRIFLLASIACVMMVANRSALCLSRSWSWSWPAFSETRFVPQRLAGSRIPLCVRAGRLDQGEHG
jgi:hypothetical protein